jgi:hypothetical protein
LNSDTQPEELREGRLRDVNEEAVIKRQYLRGSDPGRKFTL